MCYGKFKAGSTFIQLAIVSRVRAVVLTSVEDCGVQ
jgi:hypothetical protein